MLRFGRWFLLLTAVCTVWGISGCGQSEPTTPETKTVAETIPTATKAAPTTLPEVQIVGEIPQYDPDHPQVAIETNLGTIRVELLVKEAPMTVANFLGYANRSFYDNTIVHEVSTGFVAFAGAYATDLKPKNVDLPIPNEAKGGRPNKAYTLAMARSPDSADSATSQFFFNLADNPSLNHKGDAPEQYGYSVFGEIVAGREIVDRIAAMPVLAQGEFTAIPAQTVTIRSIRRIK
ncbi:MAG: peptidylprolyl isomerase [Pirellulales bacterium]